MDKIIQIFFQWKGLTEGLKKHYDTVKKVCEEEGGVKLLGLYGPYNDRWNWVYMFKVESHKRLEEVTDKIDERYGGRP